VLDVEGGDQDLPDLPGVRLARLDAHTIEAEVPKSVDLSRVFAALDGRGIRVKSMRNKSNRLEELFMRLVERPAGATP